MESTENIYHVTTRFAHASSNNKNKKWQLKRGLTVKLLHSELIFFGLDRDKITSYGQKNFRETNNCLCKVSTA